MTNEHVGLLTAGIPCQPYSVAGKRGGNEDDRALWPAARRIISEARPRWVCIENVVGFIGLALDGVLADLEREGYAVGVVVLPACAVGASHRRDRVWIIAHDEGAVDGEYIAGSGGRQTQQSRSGAEPADVPYANGQRCKERVTSAFAGEPRRAARRGDGIASAVPACQLPHGAGTTWRWRRESADGGGPTPNPHELDDDRCGFGAGEVLGARSEAPAICSDGKWRPESRLGGGDDDVPARVDFPRINRERYLSDEWESGIPRVVTEKVPNRTHRLKALGNAIVPAVAYEIFRAIKAIDH